MQRKVCMSGENKTPTRQFVEIGDIHNWGEWASEGEDHLQSQLFDRIVSSSEVDRRIKAFVVSLATQLETLIQLVLSERSSNRSTEGNAVLNDRDPKLMNGHSNCTNTFDFAITRYTVPLLFRNCSQ